MFQKTFMSTFKNISMAVFLVAVSAGVSVAGENGKVHQPTITPQTSGTTQLLISVSPVNSQVVWAAGQGGTYVVTTNGGKTWKAAVVPGAEALEFRDVFGGECEDCVFAFDRG